MNKGWFKVPGIRPDGDRTIAEQMMGLDHGLSIAKGKSVLDLGCAEGLISLEFAKAGASRVVGIELLEEHLKVAEKLRAKHPDGSRVHFIRKNLGTHILDNPEHERFDIVLILGIIHKLENPAVPLRFAANCAKEALIFRAPAKATDGVVRSKHTGVKCNVPKILNESGFKEFLLVPGVRGEAAQYWRRMQ